MQLPSIGLLNAVLGFYQVLNVDYDDIDEVLEFEYFEDEQDVDLDEDGNGGSRDKKINIYEFAHKCKVFCFDKGFELIETEFMVKIKHKSSSKFKIYEASIEEQNDGKCFDPGLIFKAAEYALQ